MVQKNYNEPYVVLRSNYVKKNGEIPVLIRVLIDKQNVKYSAGVSVNPDDFDKRTGRIKRNNNLNKMKDKRVQDRLKRAREILIKYFENQWYLDHKLFRREFDFNTSFSLDNFNDYINYHVEMERSRLTEETLKTYRAEVTKLANWNGNIKVNQITKALILEYDAHMRWHLQNKPNTRSKSLSFLRKYVIKLYKEKRIEENPFDEITISFREGVRSFLTQDEVNRMKAVECNTNIEKAVKEAYIFSCYTGMRFTDVKKLSKWNVNGDVLSIHMQKTARPLYIPIMETVEKMIGERINAPSDLIFYDLPSNQVTNRTLKVLAKRAEIFNKNVTFHTSRHTFATIALNSGINMRIIQAILGHNRIRTTEIYAKLATKTIRDEMQRFNI